MKRFERLLNLVAWLQRHPFSTAAEVAQAFGMSVKEVEEDIAQLTLTGKGQGYSDLFDIHYDKSGISVRDSLGIDRPIQFDTAEIGCLLVGIETLLASGVALDVARESIESAREKISGVINAQGVIRYLSGALVENSDAITTIQTAILEKRQIDIAYWNSVRDDATQRRISPFRIRGTDAYTIVDAYCHTSNGWRSFRLDHMLSVEATGEQTRINEQEFEDMQYTIVEIEIPTARSELLEDLVVLKKIPNEKSTRAYIQIVTPATLARSVRASGGELRILGPEEINESVDELNRAALRAYQ
ncbi:MAG: helix-turn-helix transcriptional regulator [Candidatus Nanopelagicales bacterium]